MPRLPLLPLQRRLVRGAALAVVASALLAPAAVSATTTASVGSTTVVAAAAPPSLPVAHGGAYDYAPSVVFDERAGLYRMWWCGGIAGDHVLYAESTTLAGPFHGRSSSEPHSFDIALTPSPDRRAFDRTHTCDPSVVKVGRTWFMYYGGANERERGAPTRIGVASSRDGITWRRLNDGEPIVVPHGDSRRAVNGYGAGQPSVTHVDGLFYLVFTDTTGRGGNQGNGAGQYVLRSADPLFQTGVEELQANGFAPYNPRRHTRHSLLEAFSTDWVFSPSLDAFVLAESYTSPGGTRAVRLHFFSRSLTRKLPGSPTVLRAGWNEGTALVGSPGRQLTPPVGGVQRVEVLRPLGQESPYTWRIYPVTADTTVHVPTP